MAIMPPTMTITHEKRPCLVDDRVKAIWHTWAKRSYLGRNGEMAVTVAVVEYEDGGVDYVLPTRLRFLDTAHKMQEMEGDFAFAEERGLIKTPRPSKEAQE